MNSPQNSPVFHSGVDFGFCDDDPTIYDDICGEVDEASLPTPQPIERKLHIDESGAPGDDRQPWLVFAGVEVPDGVGGALEEHYRAVCDEFLPSHLAKKPELDLKGKVLFGPTRVACSRLGLSPDKAVELGRQLLNLPPNLFGVRFHVSAIKHQWFPDEAEYYRFFSTQYASELLDGPTKSYLFALTEMVATFSFFLNRYAGEEFYPPPEKAWIDKGVIVLDESPTLRRRIEKLEGMLRQQEPIVFNGITVGHFSTIKDNIKKWEFVNSRVCIPIQLADILASIVRLKLSMRQLPRALDRVFWVARVHFDGRSHFYPHEDVDCNEAFLFC